MYRIVCRKVLDSHRDPFTIWFLADANPFAANRDRDVNFFRYITAEPDKSPIEYIDGRSGKALLAFFGLTRHLLPHPSKRTDELLFEEGMFLGHPLIRREMLDPQLLGPPDNLTKLVFNPDLLIGTSRNFRDDGKGRKTEKENYNYIPFTKENYDEMIAAGINYWTAKGEQIDWIKRRAVFYEGYSPRIDFPEELFRPNFRGLSMFIDEPASRLAGKYARDASPTDAVKVIQDHIRERLKNRGYESILRKSGIDLGSLELPEPGVPK